MGAHTDDELTELDSKTRGLLPAILGVAAWLFPLLFLAVTPLLGPGEPHIGGIIGYALAGVGAIVCSLTAVVFGIAAVAKGPNQLAGCAGLVLGLTMIILLVWTVSIWSEAPA